ncbi:MAG: NAD(P)H-hydrate dehydratase [Massilia sp.]
MKALYEVAQIRAVEQAAASALAPGALMERAGEAAARLALDLLAQVRVRQVLVLAGPGNNGGDALEVAANLARAGVDVTVIHLPGTAAPAPETARALARARSGSAQFVSEPSDAFDGLVIDGLFGIGLARPLAGQARELVSRINALALPVLALDVPSGLDADTGAIVGPDGVALRASATISFIADKPGLHTADGHDVAGEVHVAALGIDPSLLKGARAALSEPALFAAQLAPRRQNSHKGSYGDVAVIGGAPGMGGAAILAARAALYTGAGRVFVAAVGAAPALDSSQPEIMMREAASFDAGARTLVLGPGMGDSAEAIRLLAEALDGAAPLVLDADALNLVAASIDLQQRVARRAGATLMTPHPLEAARLLGTSSAEVQCDRLTAARTLAARHRAVVVLKGSGSIIARADGQVAINPTGNPGLASGGTGDVLSGMCGSLLAQGWPAWEAALGAVWMHGAAADWLVAHGVGPVGMTAGELAGAARAVFNQLVKNQLERRGLTAGGRRRS